MLPNLTVLTALLAALPAASVLGRSRQFAIDAKGTIGGTTRPTTPKINVVDAQPKNDVKTTPGKLRFVENSGECEAPGVYQASGYGDLAANESIWFWFFEARNNADTAPLTVWLNGGPGSSSMIGLFQEHGPCRITNDSKSVTLNPNSWNEVSNMLYIDQPVGVGYSHGTTKVGTSRDAAKDLWNFLQIFFNDPQFSKYQQRQFSLWTESYGGHYGPALSTYILDQNAAIANGSLSDLPINLKVLAIGDGLTDAYSQFPGYVTYAKSNPYHYPYVAQEIIDAVQNNLTKAGGCLEQISGCYDTGVTATCADAQEFCNDYVLDPILGDEWDPYFILAKYPDPYPPALDEYLNNKTFLQAIGAESGWEMTSDDVYFNFAKTGDWMLNFRPDLERVVDAGVRTLIYVADADFLVNPAGIEYMIDAMHTKYSEEYAAQAFGNYTVNGVAAGVYKNAGTFSYLRAFGAGHEIPAYSYGPLGVGEVALQFFSQINSDQSLKST
ncbi:serine carboxypeptidase [Trametes elegans]|nr:serine carboxypeptidase [Trametes elegans]